MCSCSVQKKELMQEVSLWYIYSVTRSVRKETMKRMMMMITFGIVYRYCILGYKNFSIIYLKTKLSISIVQHFIDDFLHPLKLMFYDYFLRKHFYCVIFYFSVLLYYVNFIWNIFNRYFELSIIIK